MKREGHLIEEIVQQANMADAFDKVLRGNERKKSVQGKRLLKHREQVIRELTASISDGSFRISQYHEKEIMENGKLRRIQIVPIKERIAVHAVMTVVDEHIRRRFIRTTSASIKGRGMHDLMKRIHQDLQTDPDGTRYCYMFDIRKFYESIDQATVKECIRKIFKDKRLIRILDGFIEMTPKGISIGLRSSQSLGNLLLSFHLDHFLKDEMGVRYFYRYCDNGEVLASSKAELWNIREAIHKRMNNIGLTIKPNERIFPTSEGVDALGYVIYPDHVALRKNTKKKFARKMQDIKSRKRRRELTASFYGMVKHADCNNLYLTLTGKDMKSFKDLNVSFKPEDGKKRFAGAVISIRELVNLPIIVKDYEMGVKTSQGEDRCIIAIEVNGEPKKFFTNSEEMKNILTQISEMPDGFPFETIIKSEPFGKGRTKYVFT